MFCPVTFFIMYVFPFKKICTQSKTFCVFRTQCKVMYSRAKDYLQ